MFIANRPGAVRPGSSGQILPGYEARIVDENDQPVADGQTGNLLIKGDSVCAGYWNQHEKTKTDQRLGHSVRATLEKARIRPAAPVYATGLSLKQASSLTETSELDLLRYIEKPKGHEQTTIIKTISKRVKEIEKLEKEERK